MSDYECYSFMMDSSSGRSGYSTPKSPATPISRGDSDAMQEDLIGARKEPAAENEQVATTDATPGQTSIPGETDPKSKEKVVVGDKPAKSEN